MSTSDTTEELTNEQKRTTCDNYIGWVEKELDNESPTIRDYATLIISEYKKLSDNLITIQQFEENTPQINDETPLNYIRDRIIIFYPK